jgi:nucleoid-associated protein YgaU
MGRRMSNKPLIQDGTEVREMTAAEYAQYQQLQAELETVEAAKVAQAAAKQAVLEKLGLTAAEVSALLG